MTMTISAGNDGTSSASNAREQMEELASMGYGRGHPGRGLNQIESPGRALRS